MLFSSSTSLSLIKNFSVRSFSFFLNFYVFFFFNWIKKKVFFPAHGMWALISSPARDQTHASSVVLISEPSGKFLLAFFSLFFFFFLSWHHDCHVTGIEMSE